MDNPRVLVLTTWFLPGYRAGGPIKSVANLVAALSNDADFAILTSDRDEGDAEPYRDIVADRWLTGPDGRRVFYASPRQRLRDVIDAGGFDVLYLNSVFSPRFALLPALRALRGSDQGVRVVIAPRGSLQHGALGIKKTRKRVVLWIARASRLPKRAVWHATDQTEVDDIARAFGTGVTVVLAPNLPDEPSRSWLEVQKTAGRVRLVFFSRISRKKNLDYLLECLGEAKHTIELDVIGPSIEAPYLRRCEELARAVPPNVSVRFLGPMHPDALAKVLPSYHFALFPTLGENFGHAIFEALQAGKPVLISDQTPWRGLQALGVGWDLPLSDRSGFIAAIEASAAMDQLAYNQMSRTARNYAIAWLNAPDLIDRSRRLFS